MKAITTVIAGLIASTTTLPAQDTATQSPNQAGIRNLVEQVTVPSILWTNRIDFPSIERQSFTEGISIRTAPGHAVQSDRLVIKSDYQVIVLPLDDAVPAATEDEVKRVASTESNTSPVHRFTEDDFLYLQYRILREAQTMQKENPAQHLYIEPLSAPRGTARGHYEFSEFIRVGSSPKPAWHEWINPRTFIPKWAELWMTETDATPVVLVMTTF